MRPILYPYQEQLLLQKKQAKLDRQRQQQEEEEAPLGEVYILIL
jgi:hypothetical protein